VIRLTLRHSLQDELRDGVIWPDERPPSEAALVALGSVAVPELLRAYEPWLVTSVTYGARPEGRMWPDGLWEGFEPGVAADGLLRIVENLTEPRWMRFGAATALRHVHLSEATFMRLLAVFCIEGNSGFVGRACAEALLNSRVAMNRVLLQISANELHPFRRCAALVVGPPCRSL